MTTLTILVTAAFLIGFVLGSITMYLYVAGKVQQTKQQFADELHRIIERQERAANESRRIAA
jgi:hypothetical protein